MGRIALFSDVHANLEALLQVLEDIRHKNIMIDKGYRKGPKIEEIWFLGDAVGYGPDPVACYKIIQDECSIRLAGNHEIQTRGKIDSPNDQMSFVSGPGGKAGIQLAVRQILGDDTPIQQDLTVADAHTRLALDTILAGNYTQRRTELAENVKPEKGLRVLHGAKYAAFYETVLADPDNKALLQTFERLGGFCSDEEREKRHAAAKELIDDMNSLPTKKDVEKNGKNALLSHDNHKTPGDGRYLLPAEYAGMTKASIVITDAVFAELKNQGYSHFFFAHRHLKPGIQRSRIVRGIQLVNLGSVGWPRCTHVDDWKITYAIWNPEAQRQDVRMVSLPYTSHEVTAGKMRERGLLIETEEKELVDKLTLMHRSATRGEYASKQLD